MVLTITLNPLLERRYLFSKINFNAENRNGMHTLKAGGKGINVSRQLNKLGLENIALTFTGGVNGKLFKDVLRNEGISFVDIQTKEETRDAAVILENSVKKVSTFFRKNNDLSDTEANAFASKMEKMIATCEIVVFAGSSPCAETNFVIPEGIEIANRLDKISICDTYGDHLQTCIDASPSILHNNIAEIESSLKIRLKTQKEKLSFLNYLYSKGIKQSYITDGENPFYSSNFDFHYKVTVPKIDVSDSTGSGDSFVAGLVYGWHNKFKFDNQLSFATALAVKNAENFETCLVSKDEAELIKDLFVVESVGKKLKTINDKPD